MSRLAVLFAVTVAAIATGSAEVKGDDFAFASYYSNGMVLQRSPQRAAIWGYAPLEAIDQSLKLTVQSDNSTMSYEAKISKGAMGKAVWKTQLKEMPGSLTSYVITASLANHPSIKISDVLFGDVWVCSGQSNMVFIVNRMFNRTDEYAMADQFPNIRLLLVSDVQSKEPLYDITQYAFLWAKPTKNTMYSFSAVCWLFARHVYAKMGVPMGMITTAWGGTPVEAWSSPESLAACGLKSNSLSVVPGADLFNDSYPNEISDPPPQAYSVLYNAMIHPFLNMSIYGVLWYQGEQNAHAATRDLYNCTFPAMIDDWRSKWHDAAQTNAVFPFGFVQLGPDKNTSYTHGFPDIRWHQTADVGFVPNPRMKNVFMAAAVDLTDLNSPFMSVHYRDKGTVGQRLSLAGLAIAYNQPEILYQGPFPSSAEIDHRKYLVRIIYNGAKLPITMRSDVGFEVCCKASKDMCEISGPGWNRSLIVAHDEASVTLTVGVCADKLLLGVRYIWRESPCIYKQCPVYSATNELPAPPFVYQGVMADFRNTSSTYYTIGTF